jgi:hypothetical protein
MESRALCRGVRSARPVRLDHSPIRFVRCDVALPDGKNWNIMSDSSVCSPEVFPKIRQTRANVRFRAKLASELPLITSATR